jgi:hypothetical protein
MTFWGGGCDAARADVQGICVLLGASDIFHSQQLTSAVAADDEAPARHDVLHGARGALLVEVAHEEWGPTQLRPLCVAREADDLRARLGAHDRLGYGCQDGAPQAHTSRIGSWRAWAGAGGNTAVGIGR